jgi:cytochrome c-type biogenesis protein CcmH/NrfF
MLKQPLVKRALQSLAVLAIGITMLGANDASTTRLDKIGHKLVCQCGCGQILMECNHVGCPVSGPMIDELKSQLAAGNTEAAIIQTEINKYGPIVLAAPIRGGFDNVAWIVPYATYGLGTVGVGLLVYFWVRRKRTLQPAAPLATPETNDLRERIRRDTSE